MARDLAQVVEAVADTSTWPSQAVLIGEALLDSYRENA